jgi:hypothetical protein
MNKDEADPLIKTLRVFAIIGALVIVTLPTSIAVGEWERTLPCDSNFSEVYPNAEEYLRVLEERTKHWLTWIDYWRDKGTHEIPSEIGLSIILHESRGDPRVVSCSNAIGLFAVIPSDAVLDPPDGCTEYRPLTFSDNPPTSYLKHSRNNIRFGLDHLEAYTWEGRAYIDGLDNPPYRELKYEILPGADKIEWWFGEEGRATLGMYQCGPRSFRSGNCGKYGGLEYADDVLSCWLPFVREALEGVSTPTPIPTATGTPTPAATPTPTPTVIADIPEPETVPLSIEENKEGGNILNENLILIVAVAALFVEALVETLKPLWDPSKRSELPDRGAALGIGLLVSILGGFDLFEAVGVPLTYLAPLGAWPGIVLTGILFSRGANFIHSLIKSVQGIPDLIKARINGSG